MMQNRLRNIAYIYALLDQPGFGPVRVNKIIEQWAASNALDFETTSDDLAILDKIDAQAYKRSVKTWIERLEQLHEQNIGFIPVYDNRYPTKMKDLLGRSTPPVLSYVGNPDLLSAAAIGFCGSRQASPKGLDVASRTAYMVAKAGAVVVSGYARGVDLEAHAASVNANGKTILVLAEGIARFNLAKLQSKVKGKVNFNNILFLSEFLPYDKWSVSRAMQRNKTIIALSKALIVIEAGTSGGTLEAGKTALKMGRPVFVAHFGAGNIAKGNRVLIQMGAHKFGRSPGTSSPNISRMLGLLAQVEPQETSQNRLL